MKAIIKVPAQIKKLYKEQGEPNKIKVDKLTIYETSIKFDGKEVEVAPSDWTGYQWKLLEANIHFPADWIKEPDVIQASIPKTSKPKPLPTSVEVEQMAYKELSEFCVTYLHKLQVENRTPSTMLKKAIQDLEQMKKKIIGE